MPTGVREDDVHYVSDFGFGLVGQRETAEPIFDINGPRGGVDKCCRITAHLEPTETVVVEELDTDLFAAIGRATEQVARIFTRRLTRMRDRKTKRKSVRIVEESLQRPPAAPTRCSTRRKRKWHVFNPEAEHEAGPSIM